MALPISPKSSLPTESPSLDPALFCEYISTKATLTHQISLSTSPSTPLYSIKTHQSLSREKPSIVMHAGADKTAPVVGVVKIHLPHGRHCTIGIGNPEMIIEEGGDKAERMVWEKLQTMKKWTYRWYQFEFGAEGEREVYTWRRTKDRWPRRLKDMELRVGKEEDGELVAIWRGSDGMKAKRGSFFIKKREGLKEEKKWELMVLLTGLSIIESYMRRS